MKETSLQEEISYGVFWRSEDSPEKMSLFAGFFESYQDAYEVYLALQKNPSCNVALIVERTEHFEIVTMATKFKESNTEIKENIQNE